ncbi:ATP-binding protein [Kiritimatiella glycovorans]|uniref:Novel STAND NTPase 1 domain-containing protein n=1 Tax=Kiritimatiella glycovorans TaxID=1307763 RepID=A0A0G3EBU3_9BACT|nr:ATP-binding protein [Kiritimatiella glycovorans]AKJ63926.1 hypothetical protein L21SP4_00657 [Kiritimatiella glycovorans]
MTRPAVPSPELTRDQPWPGLVAFSESSRDFFHGRAEETAELLRRVKRSRLSVLYSISGVGKTSLLRAGVFPQLREERFIPVYLRLSFDENCTVEVLRDQVLSAVRAALKDAGITVESSEERPLERTDRTLWETFNRAGLFFWTPRNRPAVPVLVFDQFEEAFTLGRRCPRAVDALLEDLSCLAEHRVPRAAAAMIEAAAERGEDPPFEYQLDRVRLLLSLREDFLCELLALRDRCPSIMSNEMRLEPFSGEAAFGALRASGQHLMDEPTAETIVRMAAGASPNAALDDILVEPALLSLMCFELNRRRIEQGRTDIGADLLSGVGRRVFEEFYDATMAAVADPVARAVEDALLTGDGRRMFAPVEDFIRGTGLETAPARRAVDLLVERRLLHIENVRGVAMIELTHDVLTPIVRARRESAERARREAPPSSRAQALQGRRRQCGAARPPARGTDRLELVVLRPDPCPLLRDIHQAPRYPGRPQPPDPGRGGSPQHFVQVCIPRSAPSEIQLDGDAVSKAAGRPGYCRERP